LRRSEGTTNSVILAHVAGRSEHENISLFHAQSTDKWAAIWGPDCRADLPWGSIERARDIPRLHSQKFLRLRPPKTPTLEEAEQRSSEISRRRGKKICRRKQEGERTKFRMPRTVALRRPGSFYWRMSHRLVAEASLLQPLHDRVHIPHNDVFREVENNPKLLSLGLFRYDLAKIQGA
jgi:hypothetical protein